MWEFFHTNPWAFPASAGIVFGCLIPIVAIVTQHLRKVRQAELDSDLKRELLAQGKTPEQIEIVLPATSDRGPWWARQAYH